MNLLKHYLAGVAVIAVAGTALPAQAASYNLGTLQSHGVLSQLADHGKGSFTDIFKFTVSFVGNGYSQYDNFQVITKGGKALKDITGATFALAGPSGFSSIAQHSITTGDVESFALLAGNYVATITGKATGSAGGTYNFAVAAAVPDAAGWATMGLGMALAGVFARRRMKQNEGIGAGA